MKKNILNFSLFVGLFFISCENINNSKQETAKDIQKRQSSIFSYIDSFHIDNEIGCENNILIFPSWQKYDETIDSLDDMIDAQCDEFDATVPANITDDEYDALASAANFDEDNVLIKFEDDLAFCSLRCKISKEEDIWLENQGDGEWNPNEDPDNHFIDDETERTLLSERAEVLIGDKKNGYTYYKFLDDSGNMISVINGDLVAMSQVSNGTIPTGNPNVIIITPRKTETGTINCKVDLKEVRYEIYGPNRIKRKSKVRNNDWWSHKKISALTKGYKKKNGRWKKRRTWITAGVTDISGSYNGHIFNDCQKDFEIRKTKERRRRRVKVKIRGDRFEGGNLMIGIEPKGVYSYHKQGILDVKRDYYEMPNY